MRGRNQARGSTSRNGRAHVEDVENEDQLHGMRGHKQSENNFTECEGTSKQEDQLHGMQGAQASKRINFTESEGTSKREDQLHGMREDNPTKSEGTSKARGSTSRKGRAHVEDEESMRINFTDLQPGERINFTEWEGAC